MSENQQLQTITQAIATAHDPQQAAQRLADWLHQRGSPAVIGLLPPAGSPVEIIFSRDYVPDPLLLEIMEGGLAEHGRQPAPPQEDGFIRLQHGDQCCGLLWVDADPLDAGTERVFLLAQLLGARLHYLYAVSAAPLDARVAQENARLHAQSQAALCALEQRTRRLASMHHISTVLSSSLQRDEILRTAAYLLADLFEVDHCGIVLLASDSPDAFLVAEYPDTGQVGLNIPFREDPSLEPLFAGRTVIIEQVETAEMTDDSRQALRQVGAQSVLIAPLIARQVMIGSIGLDSVTRPRAFTADERETFATIAGQLALVIQNADLYEAALAAARLKSEFLANVSHELRTPLNAIIGYSEMLLSEVYGQLNNAQRDRLARVHTGGRQLYDLINKVLDLSRIEAGQMPLRRESVPLDEPVRDALSSVMPQAEARGLTLHVHLPPDTPHMYIDPQHLRQVLINLLDNAVKFTHEGSISLSARLVHIRAGQANGWQPPVRAHDGDWLLLVVEDTGIGIAPEDQAYIFEPFRQVDGSSAREYPGTGLGLAITQQLVALNGGSIWVESAEGQGSRFGLLLPVESA